MLARWSAVVLVAVLAECLVGVVVVCKSLGCVFSGSFNPWPSLLTTVSCAYDAPLPRATTILIALVPDVLECWCCVWLVARRSAVMHVAVLPECLVGVCGVVPARVQVLLSHIHSNHGQDWLV